MACRGIPGYNQGTEDILLQLGPAQVVTDVLQDDRKQQDLEGECWQVVVEKEHPLHQEEGQVVECPAASTQGSS